MSQAVHHLTIYDRHTRELVLSIRLTPVQVLALIPHLLARPDDPEFLQRYSISNSCEVAMEGDLPAMGSQTPPVCTSR